VRAVADAAGAEQLGAVVRALRAASMVRIERLRPHWCKGWLEDFAVESGDVTELLTYLRDEHGGESYRLSVLGPDNVVIADAHQPIAGRPRDRGRLIDRDVWEGRAPVAATAQPVAVAAAPQQNPSGDILNTVLGMMRDANAAQFKAVQEMRAADSRQTAELIASINRRTEHADRPRGPTFVEQVNEIVASTRALSDMREAIAIDQPPPAAPTDDNDGLVKEATRAFIAKAMGGPQLVPMPGQQQQPTQAREAKTEPTPQRPRPRATGQA
jgi:hypothetical protein